MTDEWAIASLGQVMEGDDDDDDDVLIPPTPGQEDIDIAAATQDNSSLLGAMADSLAAGRRKLNTLSLGLSDDPESESLPFLALEWDSQFPTTPAPANGQSAESYFLNKEKEDGHSKSRHSNESCNGQSSVWEGCSASWLTKDAEASGIRTATGKGGDDNNANTCKEKDKSEQMKKDEKNVDDRGGGNEASGDGCGEGGGGDDDDDDQNKKTKKDEKEEEESSHEPSSDSSEGLLTVPEDCKIDETVKASSGDSASVGLPKTSMSIRSAVELGEVDVGSSQRDLFLSQTDHQEAVVHLGHSLEKHLGEKDMGVVYPSASLGPILHLSQPEGDDDDDDGQPVSEKMLPHTSSTATSSSKTAPVSTQVTILQAVTPSKRKISESENDGGTSEIPFKLPRTEDRSGSNESGEEKVFNDYSTLTKKDVEISPKQQKHPSRSLKSPHLSFAAKCITFGRDDSREIKSLSQKSGGRIIYETDPTLPIADKEEGDIGEPDVPQRQPVDTEEENRDNVVRKSANPSYKCTIESREASDKEDSDIEIIEDKDRSIEVVYEKSKPKSTFCDEVGSQDFSLILSGTQQDSPDLNESGQRFSEEPSFSAERISQRHCPLAGSEDLECHGTELSSIDESEVCITSDLNTMPATQVEKLCYPAVLTQPDIEPLISLPLSSSTDFRKKSGKTDKERIPEEKKLTSHDPLDTKFPVSTGRSESGHQVIREQSLPSQTVAKLQMPDILTPSTQDMVVVPESESVFLKAATAARERAQQEDKRIEEKRRLEASGSKSDSSLECMDVSDNKAGEQSLNDGSRVEITSCDSTPVSGLQLINSSQSTPVTSQSQRLISHSINFFGSGKKENISSLGLQSFAEETDSEDEGKVHRKKKKPRTKSSQPSEMEIKPLSAVKKDIIKTSTPNTSQGISPNISGVSGSGIDKDLPGISVESDTSKSRNTSSEQSKTSKSPETAPLSGTGISSQDTEILMESENILSVDELMKEGYIGTQKTYMEFVHPVTQKTYGIIDPAIDFKHLLSNETFHVIYESKHGLVSKTYLQHVSGLASGSSHIVREGRISDVSMLSRISSSSGSGYLGDKSSSLSSGSSHRLSMLSTIESSRLSLGSVVTLPSPPREKRDKDFDMPNTQVEDGQFLAPVGRAKHQPLGRIGARSPKPSAVDAGTSTRKISPIQILHHPDQDFSSSSSEDLSSQKGRGKGGSVKSHDKHNVAEPSSGQSNRGKGRGRSRGRGRGRGTTTPQKRNNKSGDGGKKSLDSPANEQESGDVVNLKTDASEKDILSGEENPISELIGTLSENLRTLLENSQVPLSEEEEEAFVLQGGADEERQLAQVMKRVREVDLKPGLLVFARFVDNNFYSAILKERDGSDRWFVQFLLDQYSTSVRDVYLLPTDVLPRGYACFVRHHTEQFSDPCVVKAHVHVGSTLLHVVETDRGITKHIPHSHMFLTAQQAQELLQARLNFRSMVASPGRDVSLDNIVAGRRRRTPNVLASPRSRKVDDNLDSSESATGEYDDLSSLVVQSPRSRKAASRGRAKAKRQNLSVLTEESEIDLENPSTPSTPRGRKQSSAIRQQRTPRTPKTSVQMSAEPKSTTGEFAEAVVKEVTREQTPLKKRGRPLGQSSSAHTPQKLLKLDEDTPTNLCLEPLPHEESRIFTGFAILLTSGDSSIRKRQNPEDEDLSPFNKGCLKQQFIMGGGKVIESYSEAEIIVAEEGRPLASKQTPSKSKKANSVVLLISNTHCRTAKFIQCLALGIPIVSFQWIIDSSTQNRRLDWKAYLLPSGEDENGKLVEQRINFEEDRLPSPLLVLKGERIFLASSSNLEFISLYQPLLCTAGAEVRVKPAKTSNFSRVLVKAMTVVVADATIPDKELKRAQTLNIPVVSTEWVIQSLIAGKRLGYRDHPKFLHDAAVSPTSPEVDDK